MNIGEYEKNLKLLKDSILKICLKTEKLLKPKPDQKSFLFHKQSHLAYCRNGKAATSTWLRTFYALSNFTYIDHKDAHINGPELFSAPNVINQITEAVLFTVVRHPFTRLISVYQDKIKENYLESSAEITIKLYRNSSKHFNEWKEITEEIGIDSSKNLTPWEFLMHVLQENEGCKFQMNEQSCLSNMDAHWMPYYVRCNPCVFDFDVISKVENFNEDVKYIIHKVSEIFVRMNKKTKMEEDSSNVDQNLANQKWILKILKDSITQPKEHANNGKMSTTELTMKIFKLLSSKEKDRLRQAYYYDFILFDYDPFEYD